MMNLRKGEGNRMASRKTRVDLRPLENKTTSLKDLRLNIFKELVRDLQCNDCKHFSGIACRLRININTARDRDSDWCGWWDA